MSFRQTFCNALKAILFVLAVCFGHFAYGMEIVNNVPVVVFFPYESIVDEQYSCCDPVLSLLDVGGNCLEDSSKYSCKEALGGYSCSVLDESLVNIFAYKVTENENFCYNDDRDQCPSVLAQANSSCDSSRRDVLLTAKKEGYHFTGVKCGSVLYSEGEGIPAAGSGTCMLQWEPYVYTITLKDGDNVKGTIKEVYNTKWTNSSGTTITEITKPTKTDYTFAGYKYEDEIVFPETGVLPSTTTFLGNPEKNSPVLYAQWTPNIYTMTLDSQGGTGGTDKIYEKYGDGPYLEYACTNIIGTTSSGNKINIPTKTGYTFGGYYEQANCGGDKKINSDGSRPSGSIVTYSGNVTFYACWTPNIYTMTLDKQGGTGGTDKIYEKYGDGPYLEYACTNIIGTTSGNKINVPTKTGYTFGGYYEQENCGGTQRINSEGFRATSQSISTYNSDRTFYACWSACTACAAGTGATCSLSVVNNTCTYTTSCIEGYGNIQNNGQPNAYCTPIQYSAIFIEDSSVVLSQTTPGVPEGVTILTYDIENRVLTLPVPTKENYRFKGWCKADKIEIADIIDIEGFRDDAAGTAISEEIRRCSESTNLINDDTYEMPENDLRTVRFYAQWSAESYDVFYDINCHVNNIAGGVLDQTGTYSIENRTITFPQTFDVDGYVFDGWCPLYRDGNDDFEILDGLREKQTRYEPLCDSPINTATYTIPQDKIGNVMFFAQLRRTKIPIVYNYWSTGEQKISASESVLETFSEGKCNIGENYTVPAQIPEVSGYTFMGWVKTTTSCNTCPKR